jgi:restriction system protein
MPVPTFDKIIDPLLRLLAARGNPVRASDARDDLAVQLGLSADDVAERLPSGQQSVFANRVGWAHDRLKRAELSTSVQRGVWQITPKGHAFAKLHAAGVPAELLADLAHPSARESTSKDAPQGPVRNATLMGPPDRQGHGAG